jgi:ATP-binding cassette subfamily A (ABC1) protein 3
VKVGVDQISFALPEGEIFGILGVNGAGKTTTFKMLTGDVNPTSGQAYVSGYKVPQQMEQVRQIIGYCPQNNALIDRLTPEETLDLFATIKGIKKKDVSSSLI